MPLLEPSRTQKPGGRARRALSLLISAVLHGSVLSWVALGPPQRDEEPRTLYEQVIRPNRNRIVWYRLQDKLPEISPAEKTTDRRPPRAEVKIEQTMVSRAEGARKADQMIWLPEPELASPKDLPSPNVVAVAPAKPVRAFTLPPDLVREARPAALPDAPEVASTQLRPAPVETAAARPQPRAFSPPPERPREARPAALPAAPELGMAIDLKSAPAANPALPVRPAPKTFIPPLEAALGRKTAAPLPEAPEIRAARMDVALPAGIAQAAARPAPRAFVPPAAVRAGEGTTALPTAPEVRAARMDAALPAGMPQPAAKPAPRTFVAPTASVARDSVPGGTRPLPAAPELTASASTLPSAAIIGLHPSASTEIPTPEGSRRAEFAGGPQLRPEGGSGEGGGDGLLTVPGLLVRGETKDRQPTLVARALEPPTSPHNLMEAARANPPSAPADPPPARQPAVRVTAAPDPRLEGRIVYSIAVQMPNVTSYTGSWILWFAEREPAPGSPPDMRPPLPLHKVDPKYIQAAVEDRVEGKVRLAAVIRKSGRVEEVSLVRGVDPRLDRSAVEAMTKWEFEPAARNGVPVDVDAVVEIPFRLAPRTSKAR